MRAAINKTYNIPPIKNIIQVKIFNPYAWILFTAAN